MLRLWLAALEGAFFTLGRPGGKNTPTLRLWLAAPRGGVFTLGRPGGKNTPKLRLWLAVPRGGVFTLGRPGGKKKAACLGAAWVPPIGRRKRLVLVLISAGVKARLRNLARLWQQLYVDWTFTPQFFQVVVLANGGLHAMHHDIAQIQ